MTDKLKKADADWARELTPEQYHVMREKGTEPPFTGKYWQSKEPGVYKCASCGYPLFDAADKFDSRTGWPSFTRPISADAVETDDDRSLFMRRTEILCARCDAHLGHVFDDGPQPTGLRYCVNSVSLELDNQAQGRSDKGEGEAK